MHMNEAPHPRWIRFWAMAALASLAAFAPSAFASLGGNLDSVEADRAHMNASVKESQNSQYTLHQIQSPEGTVVDEYVSSTGKVFAVAWHGRFVPDMQQILGAYFSQYSAALGSQQRHYGHHPLHMKQTDLVVETGGHIRSYIGRAYVPSLLPQSFNPEEIQ